jgi:ribosomal protein S18 acetylase RimI-like enzyme
VNGSFLTGRIDRKGTMVHPEFQKMGHGSWLTRHCNEIADKTGSRTFVGARPSSIKMFNNLGFKTIGMYNAHMERWGGDKDKSISWLAMREPQLL